MNKKIKLISIISLLLFFTAQSTFANKLDDWLDKYESFIETVEKAAKNKQVSKIKSFENQKEKLFAEKDAIQDKIGNFSFFQGTRYGVLNSRWGVAIAALKGTKGLNEVLEEEKSDAGKKA